MSLTLHKISRGYYAMHFSQEIHEGCLKDCLASKNLSTRVITHDIFLEGSHISFRTKGKYFQLVGTRFKINGR